MKIRLQIVILILLGMVFGALGISKRASYTNVTSDSGFINQFSVAEIPTGVALDDCKKLEKALTNSKVVLKVTPVNEPECFFAGCQQRVSVLKVFAGEGLEIDDEIYITSEHWRVYVSEKTLDTGFVNNLKIGSDYLVFLDETPYYANDIKVYWLKAGKYIKAIFNYASCDNVIYPVPAVSTYVPYAEVSNNEFFAVEQAGIDAFLALKEKLIKKYN